jgi:beta-1,4-mannosyltransferase
MWSMPVTARSRSGLRIAIAPIQAANTFVKAFAQSIAEGGYEVRGCNYQTDPQENTNVLVLHWPDDFFREQTEQRTLELECLLDTWRSAKLHHGLRLVWVAHNLMPHDAQANGSGLTERFLTVLDGIIYLSERSRKLGPRPNKVIAC